MKNCKCNISEDCLYLMVQYVRGKMYGDEKSCIAYESRLMAFSDDPNPETFPRLLKRVSACEEHKEKYNREISLEFTLRLNAGIDQKLIDHLLASNFKLDDYKA